MATTLLELATNQLNAATTAQSNAQAAVVARTAIVSSASAALGNAAGALDGLNSVISALRTEIAAETNLAEIELLTAELATQTTAARTQGWAVLAAKKTLEDAQADLKVAQGQLLRAQTARAAAEAAKAQATADAAIRANWKTVVAGSTVVSDAEAQLDPADDTTDFAKAKERLGGEVLPSLAAFLDGTLLPRGAAELSALASAQASEVAAEDAVGTALTASTTGFDEVIENARIAFERADDALRYLATRALGDYARAMSLLAKLASAPLPASGVQDQVTAAHQAWKDADDASEPEAPALLDALERIIQDEVWALVADYVEAERLLELVASAGTPAAVVAAHAAAEQAVVTALEGQAAKAAAVSAKRDDLVKARATTQTLLAARDARVAARLRGDDA